MYFFNQMLACSLLPRPDVISVLDILHAKVEKHHNSTAGCQGDHAEYLCNHLNICHQKFWQSKIENKRQVLIHYQEVSMEKTNISG